MYIFELVFIHLTPYGLEKIQNDSNVCIQFLFLGIKDVSCTVIPFKKKLPMMSVCKLLTTTVFTENFKWKHVLNFPQSTLC